MHFVRWTVASFIIWIIGLEQKMDWTIWFGDLFWCCCCCKQCRPASESS